MALRLLAPVRVMDGGMAPVSAGYPALETECACYIIGDIHGRSDLLDRLLGQINDHVGAMQIPAPHLVLIGDCIDWGPDSAGVLAQLCELSELFPNHVHLLRGHHETLMLEFLDAPATGGPLWLARGGAQTLESLGLACPDPQDRRALAQCAMDLHAALCALSPALERRLRTAPDEWRSGNLRAVFAGAPISTPPEHGEWVASGHMICDAITMGAGRISLDTGAVASGRLSALAVVPGHPPVALQT